MVERRRSGQGHAARDNRIQNQSNINMDHMVDSYEIYGDQPDESEMDEQIDEEEIVHVGKKRNIQKTNAARESNPVNERQINDA